MRLPLPSRIPIVYVILIVLITVGVVPLYFYAQKVVELTREKLGRNEKILQNTVTATLAEEIAQREKDIRISLASLTYSVQVTTGEDLSGARVKSSEGHSLLQNYIANQDSAVSHARRGKRDHS